MVIPLVKYQRSSSHGCGAPGGAVGGNAISWLSHSGDGVVRSEGVTDRAKPSDQYKEWVQHHDNMVEKVKICHDYRAAKDRRAALKARTH